MFIFKDSKKRANIYAPYTAPDGTRFAKLPRDLVEEIADPVAPIDFSDETYYRTEQDDAPYAVFTKKSDEQIAAVMSSKIRTKRDDLIDNGGCKVEVAPGEFKWFHTDIKSKQQQSTLKQLGASLPVGLMWKTMDGSFVEMTDQLANAIFMAQVVREIAIFAFAEALIAQCPNVDINEGWAERYVKAD